MDLRPLNEPVFVGLLVSLAACAVTPNPSPVATPGPTPSSGTHAAWFGQVSGWTLVDAPAPAQTFEAAASSWVAGLGFVTIQAAADATVQPYAPVTTIIAFTLTPEAGHTETELFSAMLQGLEGSLHTPPRPPVLGGPGFSFGGGEQETIVGPWAGAPYTVYLSVVGPSIGDAEAVFRQLLDRGPPKTLP